MMTTSYLLLLGAGAAGGALNSVAGGGSFLVFPSLLVAGLPPIAANATTTVALWPASLASAAAYRRELPRSRRRLAVLGVTSALGGGLGAALLLGTSDATFARILPWLMLAASVVFTFGPRVTARATRGAAASSDGVEQLRMPLAVGAILQLAIATYGGYFGGGMGIVMLATFALMGMVHIHAMNALKNLLAVLINGVAVVWFLVSGKVVLAQAGIAAAGAIAGGWFGAAFARRIAPARVRRAVVVLAWSMTTWFFYAR